MYDLYKDYPCKSFPMNPPFFYVPLADTYEHIATNHFLHLQEISDKYTEQRKYRTHETNRVRLD